MSYTTTNHISLDIYNNSIVCVNAKQGDTNARFVEVTCTENGKKIVLVQDEVKAYIMCQKPDKTNVYNDATILENGNIQIELTQQMLAEAGRCKVDVMLLDADGEINRNNNGDLVLLNSSVLTTMYFYINVLSSTVNHSDIESSNEYNALLHTMSRNVALEKELQENENGIINENGQVIQDGRVQAEEKRVVAEEARVNAENVRKQQESNRISTFNTNESNRQSTFNANEAARQKTFDDNESERGSTFTTNENQRKSEFDTNEVNRKSTFEASEKERKETFESNEEDRQDTFEENEKNRGNTFTINESTRSTTFSDNETDRTNTFNDKISTWQSSVNKAIQECEDATSDSIQAESERSSNFTNKMSEWNGQISDAISGMESDVNEVIKICNDAEALRVSAESTRVTAENARVSAENSRVNAENERVLAEDKRESDAAKALSSYNTIITGATTATGEAHTAADRANAAAESCENIILSIYPVGSIYMSVNNANPSVLFGGTWEQIKDTFLLAASDVYEAGTTGGEAEHTLTVAEIPAHKHSVYNENGGGNVKVTSGHSVAFGVEAPFNTYGATLNMNTTGGGKAHNNMPPYLAVYMWKRIA